MIRDLLTDAVAVEYEGPATLGRCGRGRLHDRVGGIGEMLWEALDRAGWVGEVVSIGTTVSLRVGVAAAPATRPKQRAQLEPLPGGVRRLGEKGWIDDQGVAWQQSVGPLNGRAAGPGYRLSASERRPEELEFGEDMLYTAAVRAGWLVGEPDEVADVPDVQITVSVARRNPRWEALGNSAAGSRDEVAASVTPTHSPDEDPPPRAAPMIGAVEESELLALALEVAARAGDPDPELIQHARGSRYDVTRTTGSIVFSEAPSYIVVMKGTFRARRPRPPRHRYTDDEEFVSYRFQTLVVDIETGQITDSGSSNHCPDLASLGAVVTDHDARG
jgi:hypothetical protein